MDMTSMIVREEVLKQDALGRVRVPLERRRALVAEFESSGNSAAQFARMAGVNYQTFCTWVQKQRKERATGSGATGCGPGEQKDLAARGGPVRLFEALVEGN